MLGVLALAGFGLTIPAANWLIGHVGTVCVPDGPCLIPVGFGLLAPSGVMMIGLALVLRDAVHSLMGWRWAALAVVIGAAISGLIAPPSLALASGAAFLFSELADQFVYAPLRLKHLPLAVIVSGAVGALIDSAMFLWLAFGSLDHLAGQVLGKAYAVTAVALLFWISRKPKEA